MPFEVKLCEGRGWILDTRYWMSVASCRMLNKEFSYQWRGNSFPRFLGSKLLLRELNLSAGRMSVYPGC